MIPHGLTVGYQRKRQSDRCQVVVAQSPAKMALDWQDQRRLSIRCDVRDSQVVVNEPLRLSTGLQRRGLPGGTS